MEKRLEGLDLNLLLTLHWLLAERNVTAAADKLGISQPAASRALGRLRGIFDDPLLVKVGGEMAPTRLAVELQPSLSMAMEQCRDVLRVSADFDPAAQTGVVNIACPDYIGVLVAAVWQETVALEAPDLCLSIVTLEYETAGELVTGQTDFCLIPETVVDKLPSTIDRDAFVQKYVLEQDFLCAIRQDHPFAGKQLTLDEYLSLDHVLISPERMRRGLVDDHLERIGRKRNIRYRAQSFLQGVPIVQYTDCVFTASRPLLQMRSEGLWLFEPPIELPTLPFCAVWHPNWTHDARHSWVREKLFEGMMGMANCPFRRHTRTGEVMAAHGLVCQGDLAEDAS